MWWSKCGTTPHMSGISGVCVNASCVGVGMGGCVGHIQRCMVDNLLMVECLSARTQHSAVPVLVFTSVRLGLSSNTVGLHVGLLLHPPCCCCRCRRCSLTC